MGFWDTDGQTVYPMQKQEYYIKDTFGLRTLCETNRLSLTNVPNKSHQSWLLEDNLMAEYIFPCLEDVY